MSGAEDRPGWRTAPGWMKALLVLSLALNLAVAGLIGGNALRKWDEPAYTAVKVEPGLDRRQTRILRMVPEAKQEQAKAILLSRRDELERARREMIEAHMAFIATLRQEPLDPAGLDEALARRHAASAGFFRIGVEQVVEIARALDAAERAALAERLEERTRRWMARWGRKSEE